MALDPEFVDILRCPETRQRVFLGSPNLLKALNERVLQGQVASRSGEPIKKALDSGLIREDKQFLYPVWDDLPVMLISDSIPVPPEISSIS